MPTARLWTVSEGFHVARSFDSEQPCVLAPPGHKAERGFLDRLTELADGALLANDDDDAPVDWTMTTMGACAAGALVFAVDGDWRGIEPGRVWSLMRIEADA